MITGLSDNEIISQVLNGNQQAYAGLVERYKSFVFTLVLRFTKNREDAEEVSQDIFIKAYRSLKDFRGESKFSTWLYTICNTTCITFLRKKKLQTHSLDDERIFETAQNQDSGMNANQVEQKSKINMVNQAIQLLSADDAQVLTLFYKAEQSLEEIARIVKADPGAIKVRLHRARARLKEKMETFFARELKDLN